jgi:subtilisin family serine protease
MLAAAATLILQQPAGVQGSPKMSPWVLERLENLALEIVHADQRYWVLHIEFESPQELEQYSDPDVHIFHRFERFADAFVAFNGVDALNRLSDHPDVAWVDVGGLVRVPPPPPEPSEIGPALGGRAEPIIRGGVGSETSPDRLTGDGVVVVVVDTGIDFRHGDFITVDAIDRPRSRLLYYWDTMQRWDATAGAGSPAPVRYPDGQPIGTIYSQPELTAELRRPGGQPVILPHPDRDGHGTSCAGIAAGNGRSAGAGDHYAGVAPEAHLIAVRVGMEQNMPMAFLLNTIIGWAERAMPDTPIVVSCSFGSNFFGGMDGHSVVDRQLNARLAPSSRGAVVCAAAGNEGAFDLHASRRLAPGNSWKLEWETPSEARLAIYAQEGRGGDLHWDAQDQGAVNFAEYVHPLAGSLVLETSVVQPGSCTITNDSDASLELDAYLLPFNSNLAATKFEQSVLVLRNEHQIVSPGSAEHVITIGSFDHNDEFALPGEKTKQVTTGAKKSMTIGARSDYSNAGFLRRRAVVKPDCVAPGQWFVSTFPSSLGGPYRRFRGTSAATPYVAGTLALLMQREPDLTRGEVHTKLREALTPKANENPFLPPPNRFWGHGKLDWDAVKRLFPELLPEQGP